MVAPEDQGTSGSVTPGGPEPVTGSPSLLCMCVLGQTCRDDCPECRPLSRCLRDMLAEADQCARKATLDALAKVGGIVLPPGTSNEEAMRAWDAIWQDAECNYCGTTSLTSRATGRCHRCGHRPGAPVCACGSTRVVRLWGGWECSAGHQLPQPPPSDLERRDLAAVQRREGIALGADLDEDGERCTPTSVKVAAYMAMALVVVALGLAIAGLAAGVAALQLAQQLRELAGQ